MLQRFPGDQVVGGMQAVEVARILCAQWHELDDNIDDHVVKVLMVQTFVCLSPSSHTCMHTCIHAHMHTCIHRPYSASMQGDMQRVESELNGITRLDTQGPGPGKLAAH